MKDAMEFIRDIGVRLESLRQTIELIETRLHELEHVNEQTYRRLDTIRQRSESIRRVVQDLKEASVERVERLRNDITIDVLEIEKAISKLKYDLNM